MGEFEALVLNVDEILFMFWVEFGSFPRQTGILQLHLLLTSLEIQWGEILHFMEHFYLYIEVSWATRAKFAENFENQLFIVLFLQKTSNCSPRKHQIPAQYCQETIFHRMLSPSWENLWDFGPTFLLAEWLF